MKFKQEIIIFLLLVFLFFSISVVSATESLDDSSTDELVLLSTNNQLVDTIDDNVDTVQSNDSADLKDTAETDESTNGQNHNNVLKISNGKSLLKATNIMHSTGTTTQSVITDMIRLSNDGGGILYLDGKQFGGGYSITGVNIKDVTVIGGTPDNPNTLATFKDNTPITFINSKFENVTFEYLYKSTHEHAWFILFSESNLTNCHFESLKSETRVLNFRGCTLEYCTLNNSTSNFFMAYIQSTAKYPSKLYYCNFTNSHHLYSGDSDSNGQFAVLAGSIMDHCNFINTSSGHHGGVFCINDGHELVNRGNFSSTVSNCNFTNITSRWFAIYIHAPYDGYENLVSKAPSMENCSFVNCTSQELGAALGISHDNTIIKHCSFIGSNGEKGSAIMIGGISNPSISFEGDNTKGNNVTIIDCYFENNTAITHGGAVYIVGNDSKIYNCQFISNTAQDGDGAAIYVDGLSTTINNTIFYNHTADKGTVYINGNNTVISKSTFENNTATNGAGVYIKGSNFEISNSNFTGNNVSGRGGAVYIEGDYSKFTNNNFNNNTAIEIVGDENVGLGGAIYVKGDHATTYSNTFNHNKARNGSAIYTDGTDFKLENDKFNENQAESYLLITTAVPKESYYDKKDINVTVVHVGGDNILNAIYNKKLNSDILLKNVTYTHSKQGPITTLNDDFHNPVNGATRDTILYQDDHEDYQLINLTITRNEDNSVEYQNATLYTDIYGNVTLMFPKGKFKKGTYTVFAEHPEDWNYQYISNTATFTILPLTNNKTASNQTPYYGSEIEFNLTINNPIDEVYSDKGYQIWVIYEHTGGE